MKRVVLLVAAVAVLGFGITGAAGEVKTVSGELVSLNCYLKEKAEATGETHKDCAVANARRGQPLAILAADDLYIIKGDWTKNKNERLLPFIAMTVSATGDVTDLNGKMMMNVSNVTAAH